MERTKSEREVSGQGEYSLQSKMSKEEKDRRIYEGNVVEEK